jgi:Flp pilus assembly protein TadG
MKYLLKSLKAFRSDVGGNIAMMFGLLVFVIVGASGAAIDFLRIDKANTALAEAGDAALIAAARYKGMNPDADDATITAIAKKLFDSQIKQETGIDVSSFNIKFNGPNSTFALEIDAQVDLLMMDLFDAGPADLSTRAEAKLGEPPYIELAMALDVTGSMNSNGKLSTLKKAANDLIDSLLSYDTAKSKIGIAPFAQYVNIGTKYTGQFWLDVPGKGWSGCVGSRKYPFNVQDNEYDVVRVPGVNGATCPDTLIPLTDDADVLKDKIDDLKASGWTYIPSGAMWAWSILSPQAPFTEGVPYGQLKTLNGTKALMIMTDGDNTRAPDYPTHNSTSKTLANSLTKEVCKNIKAEKIVVYTVAFEVTDTTIKDILRDCATNSSYYFDAKNSKALTEAFASIAASLRSISLSK